MKKIQNKMKKNNLLSIIVLLLFITVVSGCKAVQPILILNPTDMIWIPLVYIGLSWIFAKGLTIERGNFWLWFILNLVFTPILGLIIIISRLTK